jgi:signal transduction histidine kinase
MTADRRSWRRPTVRVRLTVLYGGLFLLAGSVLIALLYLLYENSYPSTNGAGAAILARLDATRTTSAVAKERAELVRQALEQQRGAALGSLLRQSLLALGLVAAAAVGLGWMVAGRVLGPVQRITETARRVADRSLHERIGLDGPRDEFKELADTFDAMLARLDRAFDSQRRFVANASHELRTPLAINRTLLELTVARTDLPAELRQVVTMLIGTSERSERLLDGLLTLARSENEAVVRRPVDLSDLAAHAVEQTAGEASTAGVVVDADPDPAPTTGDPALLERVALNLVQNGIRHNHDGGWVTVRTGAARQPGWTELVVVNTGPVVPAYDIEDLFEPFRRLTGERTGGDRGVGLGLSIVRTVVHTHGGSVRAEPRGGGGLVVRVQLPAGS